VPGRRGRRGEKGGDARLRPADDRAAVPHDDGTLHQPRPLEQQVDDRLRRPVVVLVEAELREERVLADDVGDRVLEDAKETLEREPVRLLLEVLDDVDVEPGLPRDREGAGGRVSVRVVVDRDVGHLADPTEPPNL
jgi:hypothetical protein